MSNFIEVAVSPFYNGFGWTDHGTGISFKPTHITKGVRIELKEGRNLKGIRNSIRLNNLLLLKGTLPDMGEPQPQDINPAELTHTEFKTLLAGIQEGGSSIVEELQSDLDKSQADLLAKTNELSTIQGQLSNLEGELSAKTDELSNVQSELSAKAAELSAANSEVTAKDNQISTIQSELDEKETQLSTANERIEELETLLAELEGGAAVASLSAGYTQEELEAKTVTELQTLAADEGIELTATKKADIIQEILDKL